MKKIISVLLGIAILCGMCAVPVGAKSVDKEKYIGTYTMPEGYGRPWFGFKLTIFDINDEYVDYDFEVSNAGHAREYIADRAYFVNEYTAEGTGRGGFADETVRYELEYKLTFYNNRIHLYTNGLFGDGMDFYITPYGKFSHGVSEDDPKVYYLVYGNTYINVTDNCLRIIDLNNYETIFTENNIVWNFISDGEYLYYIENWKTVNRLNLNTLKKETLFENNSVFLGDCLNNRYILYEYHLETAEDSYLYVYDIETGQQHCINSYSSSIGFTPSGRVVYMGLTGQVSPVELAISDIDGSNKIVITDKALAYSVCIEGENIYYAEALTDSLTDIYFSVNKCDSYGNNVVELTDIMNDKSGIQVTNQYVEYTPYKKILKNNGGYNTEMGKPERIYYDDLNTAVIPNDDIIKLGITVTLNYEEIQFDQPPIIQNDRTLVPMRAIFEAMGCKVFWDGDNQEIDVWQGDNDVLTLWIDNYDMWTENGNITLDVAPQIINGRTLVPVRAISESIGAKVFWHDDTKLVDILYYPPYSGTTTQEYYYRNQSDIVNFGYFLEDNPYYADEEGYMYFYSSEYDINPCIKQYLEAMEEEGFECSFLTDESLVRYYIISGRGYNIILSDDYGLGHIEIQIE